MVDPRLYETEQHIAQIIEDALPHFAESKVETHRLAQGLFKCNFPSSLKDRLTFKKEDLARPEDIRQADIICLDGIEHVQDTIGAVPVKCRELFSNKGVWPKDAKVLVYDSNVRKQDRFKQEYRWVWDKQYESPEMKDLADQIFEARFLKEDALIPPSQFPGFCFLTYSFGNRMAEMVENRLRRRLREQGANDYTIQQYFDRIKMLSIASSVDVRGLADNGPSIECVQLISRDDRAVPYWKPFADRFITAATDPGYETVDLKDDFGPDGVRRKAIVFSPSPRESDPYPNDKGHGLSRYMELMAGLSAEDVRELGAMLAISRSRIGASINKGESRQRDAGSIGR